MRRKQFYLDDDLDAALLNRALATGLPAAEHVRRALRGYLSGPEAEPSVDPLLALVGMVSDDSAPEDLAEELDHYAYGVPKGHKRRN